jgi:aspartate/methionine/tyrosine aminotransferase
MPKVSQRILDVQTPVIPVVGEMIRRHPGTISLGQGVVHYAPPAEVAAAVAAAVGSDPRVYKYGLAFGIDELLSAIAAKLSAENGVRVGGDRRIVVTAGSNMGFLNAVLAICDVDDEVILFSPYYFNHEMAIDMAGCRTVAVPTGDDYQPRLDALRSAITPRTRAIVTVSPNNPTGAVYPEATLRAINALCADHGIYHIADEAYEYFTYGDARHFSPTSIAGAEAYTIGLWSLSKAYGMAGWRVGYMVIPAHLEEAVKKIQDTNLICPPVLNQLAATAALSAGRSWCDRQTAAFGRVRQRVLEELATLGDRVQVPNPGGAFYALMRVHTDRRDMDLVETLIRDHRVAVMPGSTFGVGEGCSLRVAYGALDEKSVVEGIGRLVNGLRATL